MNPSFLERFRQYRTSQKIALVCGDTALTYAELHTRCETRAAQLRELGVGTVKTTPECYDIYNPGAARHSPWVVVISGRSAEAVIGVIAAWMAGGAYVLTEQSAPEAYIQGIIEDTNAAAVLRNGEFTNTDDDGGFSYALPEENEIACAVFTSGSTGKPKGAVLEHRVVNEMLKWQTDTLKPSGWTATAAYAPLGFIAALWEIFFPLANGLTLHMLDESTRHDLFALESYIERNAISYIFLPPNVAEVFTERYTGNALKYLRVAGGRLKSCGEPKGYTILYHLGMAENGGSVTFKPIREAMRGDIPIGKAWHTTEVRLVEGEMVVSGPSLFRGYLARKDETERKLIQNAYHSGDLVRIDDNGEFVHLGRKDWSVKIRDMKVNLQQVETALGACSGVLECSVTAQENTLIGWFAGSTDDASLRSELVSRLPEYMIPSVFVKQDRLPRNTNGKIDRSSLIYSPHGTETADISAMTETERKLAEIFAHLLGVRADSVGTDASFLRLGGDSLKFMLLQTEIARVFSQNIPYTTLLENPTPRKLSCLLQNGSTGMSEPIPTTKLRDAYPLSGPMRQMWLLWRTGQDGGRYTVSIKCRFKGEIDTSRVLNAITELTQRNTILRSRFEERNGSVLQVIEERVVVSLSNQPRREFDLTAAPLFDIMLHENVLSFTTHHIISDATGLRVLMEDFWTLYAGCTPAISAQVHDVTMWSAGESISEDENFWRERFSKHVPALPLPYDFTRPNKLAASAREAVTFSENEAACLREYAAAHDATLFQLCLASYAVMLTELTGGNAVVGVPFAGREHPDTARTIGMLVKTLPLKLDVSGMSLAQSLRHTRERFTAAWEHQEISLERLTEVIGTSRTTSRNPFYDVMINYMPLPRPLPDMGGLQPEILRGEYPGALFDLVLDVREETDGLTAVFTYAAELFKPETIRNWAEALKTLLLTHTWEMSGAQNMPVTREEHETVLSAEAAPQMDELLQAWKHVLGTDDIQPDDDFFSAGGTSLAAIRVEAALFEKGWLLSAADIFQNPKLCEMAGFMTPLEDIDWEEDA